MFFRKRFIACVALTTMMSALCVAHAEDADAPEVQAANGVANTFLEACLKTLDRPDGVKNWAVANHLPEMTGPAEARKTYIGEGDGGAAWIIHGKSNTAVLAVRANTGACAIFGEHGDPTAIAKWYDMVVGAVAARNSAKTVSTPEPDRDEPSSFGRHIGKVRFVLADHSIATVVLLTFEKRGGPYQISMQIRQISR